MMARRRVKGEMLSMARSLKSTELWREEGTGAFSSWDDVLELGKRSDGSYRVRLRRHGKDSSGIATLYRSSPFKRPERLLDILEGLPDQTAGADELPRLSLSQILIALSALVEFDPPFAAEVLTTLGRRLRADVCAPRA